MVKVKFSTKLKKARWLLHSANFFIHKNLKLSQYITCYKTNSIIVYCLLQLVLKVLLSHDYVIILNLLVSTFIIALHSNEKCFSIQLILCVCV